MVPPLLTGHDYFNPAVKEEKGVEPGRRTAGGTQDRTRNLFRDHIFKVALRPRRGGQLARVRVT